VECLHRTV